MSGKFIYIYIYMYIIYVHVCIYVQSSTVIPHFNIARLRIHHFLNTPLSLNSNKINDFDKLSIKLGIKKISILFCVHTCLLLHLAALVSFYIDH